MASGSFTADVVAFAVDGGSSTSLSYVSYHTLVAVKGTFTETGNNAGLAKGGVGGRVMSAGTGAFVLVGKSAVSRRYGDAAAGTFTLTGRAATLAVGGMGALQIAGSPIGTFVLTGWPATLRRGGPRLLSAAAGVFLVAARPANLLSAAWGTYGYADHAADCSVRWVHLFEIDLPAPYATLRWTDDLLPVTYSGTTYAPYVVSVDSISTEQGQIATGTLSIGNADNVFGTYVFQSDLTGIVVKIWQAWLDPSHPTQVSTSVKQVFMGRIFGVSLARSGQDSTVKLTLGPYSDPSTKLFPTRTVANLLRH
jgi:hypothetical protein